MRLNVFVSGRRVATLESGEGFEHQLTYLPDVIPLDFVSLTMPVQTASWIWPTLHPFFQVGLPEGMAPPLTPLTRRTEPSDPGRLAGNRAREAEVSSRLARPLDSAMRRH